MKVVVDTNTVVSGLNRRDTPPYQVLTLWREERIELLSSEDTLAELPRVLHYPKVQQVTKLTGDEIDAFVGLYREATILIDVTISVDVVVNDPDDNTFLALAITGNAHYLITGDRKHLLLLTKTFTSLIAFISFIWYASCRI